MRSPLVALQDLLLLAARLFVAKAFFWSGLTKVRDWETTLALFQDEYQVPLVSPQLAALAGTAGELLLPLLLVLGLAGRFGAAGLFVLNAVDGWTYDPVTNTITFHGSIEWAVDYVVLTEAVWLPSETQLRDLLLVWLWGPGRLSLDRWLFTRSN